VKLRGRTANVGGVLLWFFLLPLDGTDLALRWDGGQWLVTAATLLYFAALYRGAPPRLRHALLAGVVIATAGEVFFSLVIGMYEYRLHRIPLYVPPGHSILYATVFYFARDARVRRHADAWRAGLFVAAAGYSAVWLFRRGDVYGWLCFAAFCAILAVAAESRLFFLGMYVLVAWLEQIGTRWGCWYWPGILLNRFPAIPSANPPSGIAAFYFGLDVLCLIFYLRSRPRLARRRARCRPPIAPPARSAACTADALEPAEN
jgi:hypothetical protein